jgi:primosomal protein N' (replication factor Y)
VRTAEELGQAFPETKVVQSQGDRIVDEVDSEPALVIATPGAEPAAKTGYAAAVLLDTSLLLTRADLRATEEAHRRWLNAVGLVRTGAEGGTVIAVGPAEAVPLQALVRGDPAGFAARELTDRTEAHLTPAAKMITVEGPIAALGDVTDRMTEADLNYLEVLGPVELPRSAGTDDPIGRVTLRTPLAEGPALVRAVKAALATRSAKKLPGPLRVKVDPTVVG